MSLDILISQLFNGLSLSSILLMVAIGLSITFGIMGVINFAHGEFLMMGAYTTYVMQKAGHGALGDAAFLLAIPAAFLVAALFGLLVEKSLIRYLYGKPYEGMLATWGLSLILQQTARSIFGANNVEVTTPGWLRGGIELMEGTQLPYNRLFILAVAVLAMACMYIYVNRSAMGRRMRAVMQNRGMAACMGIGTRRVDSTTFAIGCGLAGRCRGGGEPPRFHRTFDRAELHHRRLHGGRPRRSGKTLRHHCRGAHDRHRQPGL